MASIEDRITELEIQLAHHQRLCEQLNEVVTEHSQQIMRLERTNLRLEEQVRTLRERLKESFDPKLDRPPHY